MMKSIRWRLPLSYAGIALLAAVSLGAVLLTILRSYYTQRELDYLDNNAQAISLAMAQLVEADLPPEIIQAQIDSFTFLSQTSVRLLDADGRLWLSSNAAGKFNVALGPVPALDAVMEGQLGTVTDGEVIISRRDSGLPVTETMTNTGVTASVHVIVSRAAGQSDVMFVRTLAVEGVPGGLLDVEYTSSGRRSSQVVRRPFYGEDGARLGYVELADGPAYGSDILDSVARGWVGASVVAVLLAAGVGWVISRRLSAPLLELTEMASRMASGDLSARADVRYTEPAQHNAGGQDEFGQLARSFNEMADQVETTITTLCHFVADAAHELHTPLTALRTNLELAGPDEHVARAYAQVERLEALTRGLLDLSRIESGLQTEVHTPLNLISLVQDTSELYASRAEQADIAFNLALPPYPVMVFGNAAQLRRAISNLLDNAIKFTPKGGMLSLDVCREGEHALVSIKDTGIGIPDDDLPYLFGRFHRGRNAASYPGSGLGLAIVKVIVESHGGTVRVDNTPPGARFSLRLPGVFQSA